MHWKLEVGWVIDYIVWIHFAPNLNRSLLPVRSHLDYKYFRRTTKVFQLNQNKIEEIPQNSEEMKHPNLNYSKCSPRYIIIITYDVTTNISVTQCWPQPWFAVISAAFWPTFWFPPLWSTAPIHCRQLVAHICDSYTFLLPLSVFNPWHNFFNAFFKFFSGKINTKNAYTLWWSKHQPFCSGSQISLNFVYFLYRCLLCDEGDLTIRIESESL